MTINHSDLAPHVHFTWYYLWICSLSYGRFYNGCNIIMCLIIYVVCNSCNILMLSISNTKTCVTGHMANLIHDIEWACFLAFLAAYGSKLL